MANAILVVDDNADLCRTLSRLLHHMGFETECAYSGADALSHVSKNKPALILLDYMMPNMSGLEVLAQVKANAQTAAIPVVMLTAVSDAATAKKAMSTGAADYWIKGQIDYDHFREKVSRFVSPTPQDSSATPVQA